MAESDANLLSRQISELKIESSKPEQVSRKRKNRFANEKLLEITVICYEYLSRSDGRTLRDLILREPRNYDLRVVEREGPRGCFFNYESIILEKISLDRNVVIFLGVGDWLRLTGYPECQRKTKKEEFRKYMGQLYRKIQDLLSDNKRIRVIFVGLVPPGPIMRLIRTDFDEIDGMLNALAYSNPNQVGFRGFDKAEFDSPAMYNLDGCTLSKAGERKVNVFLREIFEALVANRGNKKPINEWPLFKLPEKA